MKVYTNTTPLLAFAAIERFDILHAVHGKLHVVESVRKECQAGLPVIVPDLEQIQLVRLVASPSSADPRFLALDAGERDTISEALRDEADLLPPMLFYLAGITPWNYFSTCLTKTSSTFVSNAGIFGKVYFPRLVTPLSIVISNLIQFGIQFLLFFAFLAYFSIKGPDIHTDWPMVFLLTPILLGIMAFLGLGAGIIISSLTTKYRDFTFLVGFGVQLAMYATPIIYPASMVPEKCARQSS